MANVAKVVEIIGESEQGWDDAIKTALAEARKTIDGITGLEVHDMTAKVNNEGKITEYKVGMKLAFGIEH